MMENVENLLNFYTIKVREVMNLVIDEIDGDFTGWCELGSMMMFRLIRDTEPSLKNIVAKGFYNGEGHFWNVIDDKIIDTTVDQFGRIKVGVINKKWLNNYVIKGFVEFVEEDLLHMTEDTYNVLLTVI